MPLLVLAFVVVPLAELYVLIQVGHVIGALPTVALLLADSVLGGLLMRSQGRAAWRRFQAATTAGRVPGREVVDGGLVIFGGALLLTPGFVTDVLGVLLLVPPTRAVVRRALVARVSARVVRDATVPATFPWGGAGAKRASSHDDTVDGTAHEVADAPRLR